MSGGASGRKRARERGLAQRRAERNGPSDRLFYAEIGFRIMLARKAAGKTQEQVARKATVSRPSFVNIEAGKQRPPLIVIARIAVALKVPVGKLIPIERVR